MKRMSFIQLGRLGVVLGLCVACNGEMRSLGDEKTGGTAGRGTQGTDAVHRGGAGVAGSGTGSSNVGVPPYVQAPTLPIDPSCTCSSPDQICNAARQCVPRCDSAGRCAMWLSPHGIMDIYLDGSTVFFLTASAYDPLGNPTGGGSLYRVDYPNGTPTLVAAGIEDPGAILGRYAGATFVYAGGSSNSIVRITDTGVAASIAFELGAIPSARGMRGNWITYGGLDGRTVWGVNLDGDLVPQLLFDLDTATDLELAQALAIGQTQVLDDYFSFQTYGCVWLCYFARENLALGPTCNRSGWSIGYEILAAGGNRLFGIHDIAAYDLESFDVTGKAPIMKLFSGDSGTIWDADYSEGWLYSRVSDPHQLVRYPSTVGRLPQEILPANVVEPAFFGLHGANVTGDFAVGPAGLFWFQGVTDRNQPQYIFHAPLPPQPCDAELPCPETSQSCVNGYCTTP
jgi:hypothetical protein